MDYTPLIAKYSRTLLFSTLLAQSTTYIQSARPISLDDLHVVSFVQTEPQDHYVSSIRPIISQMSTKAGTCSPLCVNDRFFKVQRCIPCIENTCDTIFLYCHGWVGTFFGHELRGKGLGTKIAYNYVKHHILQGTIVTFDFPNDDPTVFNLAQDNDIDCIKLVVKEIVAINPFARIVLVGDSRGGATILNYLAHTPRAELTHIKGAIVECPPVSLQRVAHDLVWNMPGLCTIAHTAIRMALPQYKRSTTIKTVFNGAPIAHHIPLLIGRVSCDWKTSAQGVYEIARHIADTGHPNTYLSTYTPTLLEALSQWSWHARMSAIKDYRDTVHAFLEKFNFPCNCVQAQEGKHLLDGAHLV